MLKIEDRIYLEALLSSRKEQVQNLEKAIKAMGEHAFINDGLLNEGVLKMKAVKEELEQIHRISETLKSE